MSFTKEEQRHIVITDVITSTSAIWANSIWTSGDGRFTVIEGGADVKDKLFLLSTEEALWYIGCNRDRAARYTRFADAKIKKGPHWWLRSPGAEQEWASSVDRNGSVQGREWKTSVSVNEVIGVRPAMWVDLTD